MRTESLRVRRMLILVSYADLYAGLLLPPVLKRLHATEPRITVTVIAENTASDLMRRAADIAIRVKRPRTGTPAG